MEPQLESLTQQILRLLPFDLPLLRADLQQQILVLLRHNFAEMELVTREEFEIQQRVLTRSRQKLERLEQRLAELEQAAAPRSE